MEQTQLAFAKDIPQLEEAKVPRLVEGIYFLIVHVALESEVRFTEEKRMFINSASQLLQLITRS